MNKKILLFIGAGIIIIGLCVGGYSLFIRRCPESCDDSDPCTQDICSEETNYKCSHHPIPNCCGNKTCEIGETYESCSVDCPNCDDNNECTKNHYDYHEHKCVNIPILDVICCGNDVCEIGETYSNCTRDCPNCDDDNKCTKDSYDYHKQKCLNEVIIPCCGNEICDRGVEKHSNCPADCPTCDDSSPLTVDSFNYTTQKCENIITHYFIDDFEQGIQNWSHGPTLEDPTASWSTKIEESNTVFRGIGHSWSFLTDKEWDNYSLKVKFKIVHGEIHFNYRLNEKEEGPERYFVFVNSGTLSLSKQRGKNFYILTEPPASVTLTAGWHTFEMRAYGNILNIYIDNELLIKYKDTNNPVLSGGVGFETLDNSEFLLDDVEIKVITQQDVIYP